jgi:hypothetical protein
MSFEESVRRWVKLDDELRGVQEHVRELRDTRNDIATALHQYVETHQQIRDATINISDGRLKFIQTQNTQSLTFKFLEECLTEIIPNKTTTEQIMTHIKNKRTVKTIPDIKRYYSDN